MATIVSDLPPGVIRQVVIAVDTGAGPMPLSVGDTFDAVLERLRQATVQRGGATFMEPMGGGRVYIHDVRKVAAVYEQLIQMTNDPRKAGIFETGSGIALPRN